MRAVPAGLGHRHRYTYFNYGVGCTCSTEAEPIVSSRVHDWVRPQNIIGRHPHATIPTTPSPPSGSIIFVSNLTFCDLVRDIIDREAGSPPLDPSVL